MRIRIRRRLAITAIATFVLASNLSCAGLGAVLAGAPKPQKIGEHSYRSEFKREFRGM